MSNIRLYFKSEAIRDEDDYLCLTDMWRASGSDPSRRPVEWLRQEGTQRFSDYLANEVGETHLVRAERGEPGSRGGGATWAHWQLGMAYAKYLSPEFHAWCNDVVRKVMQGALAGADYGPQIRDLGAKLESLTNNVAALWSHISQGGYIARARFEALRSEWQSLADVEVAVGRWPTRRAALADIQREMREATQWGGKGKPWAELPAILEPSARAVLKRRLRDATKRGPAKTTQLKLARVN